MGGFLLALEGVLVVSPDTCLGESLDCPCTISATAFFGVRLLRGIPEVLNLWDEADVGVDDRGPLALLRVVLCFALFVWSDAVPPSFCLDIRGTDCSRVAIASSLEREQRSEWTVDSVLGLKTVSESAAVPLALTERPP